jgi:hypothetical protein
MLVMWWIPAGHIPTVEEANDRLEHLKQHGPTPAAFTFRAPFPSPDGGDAPRLDAEFCDWAT